MRTTCHFVIQVNSSSIPYFFLFCSKTLLVISDFIFFICTGPFLRPEPTEGMVLRSALLASLTDGEKSVKNLVNDTNLRLAGLLLPHQSIGEDEAPREAATPEEFFEEADAPEQARYGEPIFERPEYFDQNPPRGWFCDPLCSPASQTARRVLKTWSMTQTCGSEVCCYLTRRLVRRRLRGRLQLLRTFLKKPMPPSRLGMGSQFLKSLNISIRWSMAP